MIYYHAKCDFMVVEKQYYNKLKEDIFLIIAAIGTILLGNILLFKNNVVEIFVTIFMIGCICLMGVIILVWISGIFYFIHDIYKIVMTYILSS
jgi:hypothetical protein